MTENDSPNRPPDDDALDEVAKAKAREMTDNPRLKAALAGLEQGSASGRAFDESGPAAKPALRAPVASERQEAAVLTVPEPSHFEPLEVDRVKVQVPVDRSRVMATQMSLAKQRTRQAAPTAPETAAPADAVAWEPGKKPPLKLLTQRLEAASEGPPVVTSPQQIEAIRASAEGAAARTLGGYTQRMKEGSDHPPAILDESSAAPWTPGEPMDSTSHDEASARVVPPPPEPPVSSAPSAVGPRSSARLWIAVGVSVVAVGLGLWIATRTAPANTAVVPVSPSISAPLAPIGRAGLAPSATAATSAEAPPTVAPPETPSATATASAAASTVRRAREAPAATGAGTPAPTPSPPKPKPSPAPADSSFF